MEIVLTTERLLIRKLVLEDAPFILTLLNEPSFLQNIGDKGVDTLEAARRYLMSGPLNSYLQFGFGLYLVALKKEGTPLGICGLLKRPELPEPDLGFAFLPAFWRKGYATESAQAVVAFARDTLGVHQLLAMTKPENDGSIQVLKKIGFEFERMVELIEGGPKINLYKLM